MWVHVCVSVGGCVCVWVPVAYVRASGRAGVCVCACVFVHMCVCVSESVSQGVCVCACVRACVCIHEIICKVTIFILHNVMLLFVWNVMISMKLVVCTYFQGFPIKRPPAKPCGHCKTAI